MIDTGCYRQILLLFRPVPPYYKTTPGSIIYGAFNAGESVTMRITLCLSNENIRVPAEGYLARLIKKAVKAGSWRNTDSGYAALFGLESDQPLPLAALHAAAWEVSGAHRAWLHADPVYVVVDQSTAFLVKRVTLTDDEITALLLDLNQFLFAEDAVLFAPHGNQWLLNVPVLPDIATIPIMHMYGSNIAGKLPTGQDEVVWRRLFTELQMLLHNHPVNIARRLQQLPTVDALWFWGEGLQPQVRGNDWSGVWSDDEFIKGLAYLGDIPLEPLPLTFSDAELLPAALPDMHYLIVISDNKPIDEIEQGWAQPLWQALKNKTLEQLQLIVNNQIYVIDADKLQPWWHRLMFRHRTSAGAL